MRKISIIGAGRLGGALAIAMSRKGYLIENLIVKNEAKAQAIAALLAAGPQVLSVDEPFEVESDVVLIATRDSEIKNAAGRLAANLSGRTPAVFHTSGSLSSEILDELKSAGCSTGSIHPLVSISESALGAERFKNAFFCVEGDPAAVRLAEEIVADLEGRPFTVGSEYKALYHAAAVMACGHLAALVDAAIEMLETCGLDERHARLTLLPMIRSVIDNLESQTAAEALTGPFARADAETLDRHLAALAENVSPEVLEIYLQLGRRSLHLAQRQGASREKLDEIAGKISLAKKNFKC